MSELQRGDLSFEAFFLVNRAHAKAKNKIKTKCFKLLVLMVEDIKMLHDKKIAQSVVEMDVTRTIIIIILKQDY